MHYVKIGLYLVCLAVIVYFTILLQTEYQSALGREHLPFVLWVIDMIDLFIHEAGHLVFRLFGRVMYFMGGSLFQVIIPIATAVVFGRSNLRSLLFTLYWIGQSMVNVSVYIADAPYQRLHLISRGALHDWHWIMIRLNLMNDIDSIASVVNILGVVSCVAGICVGLYFIGFDIYRLVSEGSAPQKVIMRNHSIEEKEDNLQRWE